MASGYTANYRLCQWEPEDQFLREEFNQDNAKIDSALKAAEEKAETQLAAVGHDVYNLMLQSHYDGKVTGWKRALVFDGFQDRSLVADASESLFFTDKAVGLCRTSRTEVGTGYSTETSTGTGWQQSGNFSIDCYGLIDQVRFKTIQDASEPVDGAVQYSVLVNNKVVREGGFRARFENVPVENALTFEPFPVEPGDELHFMITYSNAAWKVYKAESTGYSMGCWFDLTPVAGESGTITSQTLSLPDRTGLRAWVRFRSGSVALSAVRTGRDDMAFTALGNRTTVNSTGESCTEREFALSAPPETGSLTFTLDLTLGECTQMEVFDYGILLL